MYLNAAALRVCRAHSCCWLERSRRRGSSHCSLGATSRCCVADSPALQPPQAPRAARTGLRWSRRAPCSLSSSGRAALHPHLRSCCSAQTSQTSHLRGNCRKMVHGSGGGEVPHLMFATHTHARTHTYTHTVMHCSDITNTLVGISGETVPEGRNLRIYLPLSNHAIW